MSLWMLWWNAIWLLRPAFVRLRTFLWFATAVVGFTVRTATANYTMIAIAVSFQGAFAGSMYTQIPAYMTKRFPTEVRATASAFCYHVGAIFGGLVAPILTWFAVNQHLGFALPMMICACLAIVCYIASLLAWPETKGQEIVPDLELLPAGPGGIA